MESESYARPASTCAAELENLSTGFFDRDGRVGPTALWLKEPHSLTALSMERSEQDARESELARAAQVALEIAQVSVLGHPTIAFSPSLHDRFPIPSFLTDDHGRALTIPS